MDTFVKYASIAKLTPQVTSQINEMLHHLLLLLLQDEEEERPEGA